jgi:acyl carrier protein
MEDRFEVTFTDEELVQENFTDLATVAALVERKLAAAGSEA